VATPTFVALELVARLGELRGGLRHRRVDRSGLGVAAGIGRDAAGDAHKGGAGEVKASFRLFLKVASSSG
jgi:hypothetical protein